MERIIYPFRNSFIFESLGRGYYQSPPPPSKGSPPVSYPWNNDLYFTLRIHSAHVRPALACRSCHPSALCSTLERVFVFMSYNQYYVNIRLESYQVLTWWSGLDWELCQHRTGHPGLAVGALLHSHAGRLSAWVCPPIPGRAPISPCHIAALPLAP